MMRQRRGFILIFALIMVSLIALLTEQLLTGVFVSSRYVKAMIAREQACLAVMSGFEIARAKLTIIERLREEKPGDAAPPGPGTQDAGGSATNSREEEQAKLSGPQKAVHALLPLLGRWQEAVFDEKVDGVALSIKFCMVSEQGKINLNEAFDFKKQAFKPAYDLMLKGLEVKGKIPAGQFATTLQEFLVKRGRKLEDVSELAQIPLLRQLDLYYNPPRPPRKKGTKSASNAEVALTDIFTVWSDSALLQPLLLSDALCAMLSFRRPQADDELHRKEQFKQFAAKYRVGCEEDMENNWENFQLLYDQKPPFLKEMQSVFSKEFGASVYSVLCYATVGEVTQRALAILKKVKAVQREKGTAQPQQENSSPVLGPNKALKDQPPAWTFEIVRLYWL